MTFREYLKKIIKEKQEKINNLHERSKASNDVNELRSLGETLEQVLKELNDAKTQLEQLDDKDDDKDKGDGAGNSASSQDTNDGNARAIALGSYGTRSVIPKEDNIEKRVAFANFVTRGTPIPQEMRDATATSDTSNAIPENLVTSIIEKIDAIGMILPRITRTSFPVGQKIPVDSVKPTASWVGEGQGSSVQKKSTLGAIVFGAFKLRCEIGMTQEVTVQTISAFEALFVKQVAEAMVKAIEGKIVSSDDGTSGNGHLDYQTLCDMEAELEQQYENGAVWFMTKKTYMAFVSMTDSVGQPIARINYGINGKAERTLLGRDVLLCGDYMESYTEDTIATDKVVAFLFDPSDYVLNTSYDLGIQSKIDWDNEDHRTKAVMSVDGAVIDRHSLVKLVKSAK